ncbi:TPA: hypothetical protein QDC03_005829 [Burkholderia cepacia]|uniref:hypothetical protein n=1 Tax=Burkholderia cepacia TaxID=292 RepID=UPI0011B1F325|nr:hypothetical protein [Burkholderia cepacia]HDR9510654.1 hypothetical protein [Burkholderia cepacia]
MQTETYAIVEAGVVSNIIVWDGNEDVKSGGLELPTEVKAVKIGVDMPVCIGYLYDGVSFAAPAAPKA